MSDGWNIHIEQTVTITRTLSSKSYPDMTCDQALEFEKNLAEDEKIENFIEELPYVSRDNLKYSEVVQIVPNS